MAVRSQPFQHLCRKFQSAEGKKQPPAQYRSIVRRKIMFFDQLTMMCEFFDSIGLQVILQKNLCGFEIKDTRDQKSAPIADRIPLNVNGLT